MRNICVIKSIEYSSTIHDTMTIDKKHNSKRIEIFYKNTSAFEMISFRLTI